MGHKPFALTSCVAAVPAALLSYFLIVDGFLKHADKMNIRLLIMVAFTLFFSVAIALMPVGIFIYGRPRKKKMVESAKAKAGVPVAAPAISDGSSSEAEVMDFDSSADEVVLDSSDDAAVFDSDTDMVAEDDELELDDTTSFGTPVDGSDFELDDSDTFSEGSSEEFEDEVIFEDDEDEEPPARKKKR